MPLAFCQSSFAPDHWRPVTDMPLADVHRSQLDSSSFKMFTLIIKVKSTLIIGISLEVISEHRFTGLLRKQGGK